MQTKEGVEGSLAIKISQNWFLCVSSSGSIRSTRERGKEKEERH